MTVRRGTRRRDSSQRRKWRLGWPGRRPSTGPEALVLHVRSNTPLPPAPAVKAVWEQDTDPRDAQDASAWPAVLDQFGLRLIEVTEQVLPILEGLERQDVD